MVKSRGFGVFVFVVCILASVQNFVVNSIGFLDAYTGSAFGCGHQWFECNGRWIPVIQSLQTFIEFSHRVGVPILTILLLVAAVSSIMRYRRWREISLFVGLSIFFVLLEAVLGGLAVVYNEPASVIATHFGVSLLAFASTVLLTIYVRRAERVYGTYLASGERKPLRDAAPSRGFQWFAWLGLPLIYLAMYVGAYISSSGAGDAFRGFPFPDESGIDNFHHARLLDWTHRSIAMILVIWMVALVARTYRTRRDRPDLYRGAWFAMIFVVLQAFSGVYLVLSHVSIQAFMLHVSIVTGLFVSLCYVAIQSLPPFVPVHKGEAYPVGERSPAH
ncbi:cytochrome oxidase assembly [Alicyclobacillus hesperidum URH17-3-68]|uniref:Cytochrome c oxidase assembly protein subunit 15 n=1 Tax=Alicyclobacillus hesperidum TaxID=89784 RepID=A0A1H2VDI7_9BACL|nr:COX15/CtaA family protein [Alicyclobacillus hesperidum]EJY57228.1 cytochrome oxidase assembly [Alicyclobacillus hesperidum URH17-3-68]SDW65949.1 cytochrome c oxidase assembly protein subunit 15 [Alicyclobacillus hesperidum]